ncbi:MAG TPA: pitrilysin family protein [Terriglobia bacterium]|nr:pitrilysin family protein [Terriglobia bacterium]
MSDPHRAPHLEGDVTRLLPALNRRRWVEFAWLVLAAALLPLHCTYAREFPPEVPPPKPFVMPAPALRVLPNGLKVIVVERHSLPLVTLRLVVRSGAESDPPNLPGTAQLVSSVLSEGTERRSAFQIAEAIDSAGGMLDTGADWDSSYASLSVLRDHEEMAFDLLADMVIHPAFAPAEVERMRKQTLSALEIARDDPAYIADTTLRRVLLAGTPYGHPEDGVPESVRRLTAQHLREFHRRHYRPDNCILAVVGDITAAEAFDRTAKYFGQWRREHTESASLPVGAQKPAHRVVVIDKPDAVQTEIRIGELGVKQSSDDFYALSVANQIIGGPAENRLFKALRSQQGLTYGASSDLVCLETLGTWVAKTFTRTSGTVKSIHTALEQMKRLRDHTLDDRDLETAKSYLIGHLALEFETSENTASRFLELMIHDLPLDYWNRFPERIRAVTPQQVSEVVRKYLDPDRSVIILVGNYSGFGKDAKKLDAETVIPLEDVDFGSPSLERKPRTAGKP